MELRPTTEQRMHKIEEWLVWTEERYADLLSRASETAALSGFDDRPSRHPCIHPLSHRAGKLCLLCDNTGWRKCLPGEMAVDPYSQDVPQVKGGFYAKSAGDESTAQKRAASSALLLRELTKLEGNAKIRAGEEAVEDAILGKLRQVSHKPRALRKIERAVARLSSSRPELAATLPHGKLALLHLSVMIPGRLDPCNPHME